jgi:hypothetical protein
MRSRRRESYVPETDIKNWYSFYVIAAVRLEHWDNS